MNQEHLTQMVGTPRSRVSHFMTKFKKLGFIDYADGLTVHSVLLSVVLHDWSASEPQFMSDAFSNTLLSTQIGMCCFAQRRVLY